MSSRVAQWSSGHPRSLTLAFYRHGVILGVAAAVVVLLGQNVPLESQPVAWYVAAAVLGLGAALVSGWLGLVFLVSGLAIGAALDLAIRHSSTADAAAHLGTAAPSYLAVGIIATVVFAVVLLGRRQLRKRPG